MQEYIIESFKRVRDGSIFQKRQIRDTITQPVDYYNGIESKRLRDFLCDPDFIINSVIKVNFGTQNDLFILDDIVTTFNGNLRISKIYIRNNDVIFFLNTNITSQSTIRLINAVKYVEPVAKTTVKEVVKKQVVRKKTEKVVKVIEPKFKELQDKIEKLYSREIRLEKTLKRTPFKMGLEKFLIKFFQEWNKDKNTIYADDLSIQTSVGRRRSLGDIYMICKYYFPELTLEEVVRMLYITLPSKMNPGFRNCFCGQVKKRVWYFSQGSENNTANATNNDEYSKQYQWYLDELNKK